VSFISYIIGAGCYINGRKQLETDLTDLRVESDHTGTITSPKKKLGWLRVKPAGKTKSEEKQLRDAVKMMMMVFGFKYRLLFSDYRRILRKLVVNQTLFCRIKCLCKQEVLKPSMEMLVTQFQTRHFFQDLLILQAVSSKLSRVRGSVKKKMNIYFDLFCSVRIYRWNNG
jgi:hypothetical protein